MAEQLDVFFVTDRAFQDVNGQRVYKNGERQDQGLQYGRAAVSLPVGRTVGSADGVRAVNWQPLSEDQ